jgi:hypothetical protein
MLVAGSHDSDRKEIRARAFKVVCARLARHSGGTELRLPALS